MVLKTIVGAVLTVLGAAELAFQIGFLVTWHRLQPHPIRVGEVVGALTYIPPDVGCMAAGAWIMSMGANLPAIAHKGWRGLMRLRPRY